MSDRLDELRRQRALLEQHLAWLDREIAAETSRTPAASLAPPQPVAAPAPTRSIVTNNAAAISEPATATTVNIVNPVVVPSAPLPGASVPLIPLEPSPVNPEAMMDQYRVAPDSLKQDVRKGCLLYFALAFVLLGLGVAVLWLAFRR